MAAGTLVLAGLLGGAALSSTADREPTGVGRVSAGGGRAAAIELPDVREGAPAVSLAALSGKPVVMNFFASWCAKCARELPAFQAVAQETGGEVAFVGIDHLDSRRAAQELLEQTGVDFPAGYDPDGTVARAYGLRGMPTTVFISARGHILERRTGEMSGAELRQTIERLFGHPARAS